jgi:hypothetical protein
MQIKVAQEPVKALVELHINCPLLQIDLDDSKCIILLPSWGIIFLLVFDYAALLVSYNAGANPTKSDSRNSVSFN